MSTPASGYEPYCSVSQLIKRYDERAIRQLCQDVNVPVVGSIDDNEVILELLREASGEVEAAACTGQRYVVTDEQNDLAELTGNSASFLAGMVAHLMYFRLWCRRPNMKVTDRPPILCEQALEFLEQLRLGERVFGILESHQAASLDLAKETPDTVTARKGVVVRAQRFFGIRTNRMDP